MQDYITAVLEETTPIETYHGMPFNQRHTVHTMAGKTLRIDDPECIAEGLKVGRSYKWIVVVSGVEKVRAFTQSVTQTGKFSGTIRQLNWEPTPDDYLALDEDLLKQPMSIVGTVNGHVLLPRMLLGGVQVGNAVTWGIDQFQLVAVYV